jgi:cysteine desulfurase
MDYHATTPTDPRVLEAMLPYFGERFGNAASRNHAFGWQAEEAVETGRKQVADLIGASPKEIVFTSGATESDNAALKGVAEMYREKGDHLITVLTEHKAVLDTCKRLEKSGFRVTYLRVGRDGLIDLGDLSASITDKTILISVMAANNEIGVVQPVAEIGRIARERGVLFHCDAVQAVGKTEFDVNRMQVDLASLSAHKMCGPKGVGALYVRRGTRLAPLLRGGSQEKNRRSGTENVAGIVGFGKAAELALAERESNAARLGALRGRLERGLLEIPGAAVNGGGPRVPNTCNISFEGVEAESLLMALDLAGVAVSTGAACAAGAVEPSHVLRAMGLPPERVEGSLRFSLGRANTAEEVDRAAELVAAAVERHRKMR